MSTMEKSIYQIKLLEKKKVAKNMLEMTFEKPTSFEFLAGQFVQFFIPDGTKMLPRFYSVCSCPSEENLRFCIKVVEEGKGSTFLSSMQKEDSLEMAGPQGRFVVGEENKPIFCVATGAGIAPIMSIINNQLDKKQNTQKIILLFGVRSQEDIFFVNYLEKLNKYLNFSYQITLSRPDENGEWTGLRGRVTDHIEGDFVGHQIYLCGNATMVKDVREILINKKVEPKQIHFEIF